MPGATSGAAGGDRATTVLTVKGMTCGGRVATVKLQLKRLKGVTAYEVSLEKGEAEVTYDPAQTNPEAIAAAVSETGFKASVKAKDGDEKGKAEPGDARSGRP